MNELPRRVLREIVKRNGESILAEPKRCENLLRDLCGRYVREINVLVEAIEEGVPQDLLSGRRGSPLNLLLSRVAKRLQERTALTSEASRWGVGSWALALEVGSESDIQTWTTASERAESGPKPGATEPDREPVPRQSAPPPPAPRRSTTTPRPSTGSNLQPPRPRVNPWGRPTTAPAPPTQQRPAPPSPANSHARTTTVSRVFRGCLFIFIFLTVVSTVLFFGVPYAIEVMRETQLERNNQPPRFPGR